jgi:hypothetical protein
MKNIGSVSEYSDERANDLLMAYFAQIKQCSYISMPDIYRAIVNSPTPRFYVSAPRASVVIAKIEKGEDISYMRPTKKEMFYEIHRRFTKLKDKFPKRSICQIIEDIIEQPAPKFYLTPGSAKIMIQKAKKKWYAEKRKRLLRHK